MKTSTLDSFFAGIGGIDLGFEQTNHFHTIWANEFDRWAQHTYHINFPKVRLDPRDINNIPTDEIPKADIMVGGFPCQSFSMAGLRKGFNDPRGILFFQMLRGIKAVHPKAILLENVKNLAGFHNGREFRIIRDSLTNSGYYLKWKVMNTDQYGNLPQNRERVYIVGFTSRKAYDHFHFPKPVKLTKSIHDIFNFQTSVDSKYYFGKKDYIYPRLAKAMDSSNNVYEYRRGTVRKIKSGLSPAITSICGEGGDNAPMIYTYDHKIRSVTPRECLNAQGFPQNYKIDEAKMHLYKQAGNAVSVPVIKRIADHIYKALKYFDNSNVPYNLHKKYALIYVNMHGRYAGSSYTVKLSDKIKVLKSLVLPSWLVNNKTFSKNVRNRRTWQGYMIEPVINNYNNLGND